MLFAYGTLVVIGGLRVKFIQNKVKHHIKDIRPNFTLLKPLTVYEYMTLLTLLETIPMIVII